MEIKLVPEQNEGREKKYLQDLEEHFKTWLMQRGCMGIFTCCWVASDCYQCHHTWKEN